MRGAARSAPHGRHMRQQPAATASLEHANGHAVLQFLLGETPSIASAPDVDNGGIDAAPTRRRDLDRNTLDEESDAGCSHLLESIDKASESGTEPDLEEDEPLCRTCAGPLLPSAATSPSNGSAGESSAEMRKSTMQAPRPARACSLTADHDEFYQQDGMDACKWSEADALCKSFDATSDEHDSRAFPMDQCKATTSKPPTSHSEVAFAMAMLAVLSAYVIAIVYRVGHPINEPLPNVDHLFKPWNISNMSVQIVSPQHETNAYAAVHLEWTIVNFPLQAIREQGPEPFQYRVFLNTQLIVSEVDFWSEEDVVDDHRDVYSLNKTLQHRIDTVKLAPGSELQELRVEVTFPIPGSDDQLHTLSDSVIFTRNLGRTMQASLALLSPQDGAIVDGSSGVSIEYAAANIDRLLVTLDKHWGMWKTHIEDGILLLHGLSAGAHELALEAYDQQDTLLAASTVHFVVEHASR